MTKTSTEEAGAPQEVLPSAAESPRTGHEYVCALEAFPSVLKKIFQLWGTREFDKLVHELILDTRDGTRQGFPVEVAQELLFLAKCNKYVRALDVSKNRKISIKEAFRMVDSGDEAHLPSNHWNDPLVSKDASIHHHHRKSHPKIHPNAPASSVRHEKIENGKGPLFWFILLIILLVVIKLLFPKLLA